MRFTQREKGTIWILYIKWVVGWWENRSMSITESNKGIIISLIMWTFSYTRQDDLFEITGNDRLINIYEQYIYKGMYL